MGLRPHTYESRGGSHVVLEFADPTSNGMVSPVLERKAMMPPTLRHHASSPVALLPHANSRPTPMLSRAASWCGVLKREGSSSSTPAVTPSINSGKINGSAHTRLQATFQVIKNMSAGLASPRYDHGLSKKSDNGDRSPGYFDISTEEGGS